MANPADRRLLAAAAENFPRMLAVVALLLVDGLRISEALGLDIGASPT